MLSLSYIPPFAPLLKGQFFTEINVRFAVIRQTRRFSGIYLSFNDPFQRLDVSFRMLIYFSSPSGITKNIQSKNLKGTGELSATKCSRLKKKNVIHIVGEFLASHQNYLFLIILHLLILRKDISYGDLFNKFVSQQLYFLYKLFP